MGVSVSTIVDVEVGFTLHLEAQNLGGQNPGSQNHGGRWLVARIRALHFRRAFLVQRS
jgi:hypothetical protein